jgi:hypothetical protein
MIYLYLMDVHLMGVHLMGVHLMGLHLTGMHLMETHFMGMHLIGVHLMGVYLITLFRGCTATGDIAGSCLQGCGRCGSAPSLLVPAECHVARKSLSSQ